MIYRKGFAKNTRCVRVHRQTSEQDGICVGIRELRPFFHLLRVSIAPLRSFLPKTYIVVHFERIVDPLFGQIVIDNMIPTDNALH